VPFSIEKLRRLHSALLVGYGDVLRAKGMWGEAEDAYLAVMQEDPEDVPAQLGLLFVLLDSGKDGDTALILLG
jgi:hypothetical protein